MNVTTIANGSLNKIKKRSTKMADKEPINMRTPFPANQISKLPKPTKQQTEEVKRDFTKGVRCTVCGGWHHPKVVHLDYVGHAALTARLLDVDPNWNWEPFAVDENGLPAIDNDGGLWIRLTVLGVTRIGYGDAQGKTGGDAMKERIGDALRNAGMRFGAALDLWHKGGPLDEEENESVPSSKRVLNDGIVLDYIASISGAESMDALRQYHADAFKAANKIGDNSAIKKFNEAKDKRKDQLTIDEDIPQ